MTQYKFGSEPTVKTQVDVHKSNLKAILNSAVIDFQEKTGLQIDELRIVTAPGWGSQNEKFLYVDVIIKL